jgi:hypothetical protein
LNKKDYSVHWLLSVILFLVETITGIEEKIFILCKVNAMINKEILKQAINKLGIQGSCICVHSSLKSFGCHIERGAKTFM